MAKLDSTTKLNELKINIVDTYDTFNTMEKDPNQLYFIEQELPVIADSLKNGHTFKVNLASNNASTSFTGEQNIHDIGVSGTLPVAQGGTGQTSIANIQAGKDSAGNTITSTYLKLSGGNMTGHIYLTGSQANSSTANTSQLIFGTSTTEHIAISSNTKALILNPTHSSTTNQIVLYLDKASKFPSGIEANITGNLTGKATTAGTADVANSVAWNNVSSKPTTFTPAAHTHGNITNDGKITGDGTAIGNGDRLVFVDATDSSNIIRKTNIAFDHATKTEFLSKNGSWETPIEYIKGTQTTVTNQWTGITKDTALYQGKIIAYHLPYASSTSENNTSKLTLTLNNGAGGNTNAISVYEAYDNSNAANRTYLTEIYPAGTILFLMYVPGERWQIINKKDLNVYEAYLKWGGKNFAGDYGPIDGAMIDVLRANRFAFLKPAGLTVEYSTDNGSTWLDYGLSDTDKVGLFGAGGSAYLGKHNVSGTNTVQDQLRITINTSVAKIYTVLNKIAIYMSTQGNTVDVKVEKALESTPTTYTTHLDWTKLNGWSGWNILNINDLVTYGNTANSQYGRIRFIFRQTALYKNKSNSARILRILGYGGMGWGTASNMAASGHIYSYDNNQITTFPNDIRITNMNIDKKATLATSAITTDRVFTFPDKNGTFALVSDIPTSFNTSNITGLATLTIGTSSCQVFASDNITIPIYDGTYS